MARPPAMRWTVPPATRTGLPRRSGAPAAACRAALAAVVLALAFTSAPGLVAAAPSKSYSGSVVGDPAATVSFQVETGKSGKPKRASFGAANVEMFCDDGSVQRATPLPITLRFRSRRIFRGESYSIEPGTSYETYYEVSGRLLSGGRTKGTIVFISDVFDPAGTAPAPNPDCSTGQEVAWTGQRAG